MKVGKILLVFVFQIVFLTLSAQDTNRVFRSSDQGVSFDFNFLKKKINNGKLNSKFSADRKFDPSSLRGLFFSEDSTYVRDTNSLAFPFDEKERYEFQRNDIQKRLYLGSYPKASRKVEYDHELKLLSLYIAQGDYMLRPNKHLSIAEYVKQQSRNGFRQDMADRNKYERQLSYKDFFNYASILGLKLDAFGGIFGDGLIKIRPMGSGELLFGIKNFYSDNPQIPEEQKSQNILDFQQNIQFSVNATIGDKFEIGLDFNTQTSFDFENQFNIRFKGGEDDLLQDLVFGNVSFPNVGSLIKAPSSLFGARMDLKFGHVFVTTVVSEQKGEINTVRAENGASIKKMKIRASEYEHNKHFFLSHYFKDHYSSSMENAPLITSGVNITRIEVWATNSRATSSNTRNIIGFVDLAEPKTQNLYNPNNITINGGVSIATNEINSLYSTLTNIGVRNFNSINTNLSSTNFKSGLDYEKIENARLLSSSEYEVNEQLGYISLKAPIRSDEILAVAFEYVYQGRTYKVGELSSDGLQSPNALILKLIKGSNLNAQTPTWPFMMKNIYSLKDYQLSSEDFNLNIFYEDNNSGAETSFLPIIKSQGEKKYNQRQILQLLGLDNLNAQNTPGSDGNFDFLKDLTINTNAGYIIFPKLEPFGDDLAKQITGVSEINASNRAKVYENEAVKKYVFKEIYTSSKSQLKQLTNKDKYLIKIKYKSDGTKGIPLNSFNVKRGSVKVTTSEGLELKENSDYTVDYTRGVVQILNPLYSAPGVALNVSSESNSLYNQQTKSFVGTRVNYKPNDKMNLGGTFMYYSEKPLTQKVNTGMEPVANMMFGLDGKYSGEAYFLTKAVNYLPNIESESMSNYTVSGEFAYLKPDVASGIEGVSYVDDFEASESFISLKDSYGWEISSTPIFDGVSYNKPIESGYNRAKLAWYDISYSLNYDNSTKLPDGVTDQDRSGNYTRYIAKSEIYPNKDQQYTSNASLGMLDLAFYPEERGPYNFDVEGVPGVSAGLTDDNVDGTGGRLKDPKSRWAGIIRDIPVPDFEESNIEYIEFWMMDPFLDEEKKSETGELYFNIGDISEDILLDGRKEEEQNLPITGDTTFTDKTVWGVVSSRQSVNNSFDNDTGTRSFQDVGFDGLNNESEKEFYANYIQSLIDNRKRDAIDRYREDPSADDYVYYRSSELAGKGILERYKNFNGQEGNSAAVSDGNERSSTIKPNSEDVNDDNTLNENNDYYEYKIKLSHDMEVGDQYIVDKKSTSVTRFGIKVPETIWYKFRIPISAGTKIGNINGYSSMRFFRIYLKNFEKPVVCRFASMNLVRSNWRKYEYSLKEGQLDQKLVNGENFEVGTVNIEENESKKPVNYLLPPGVEREKDLNNESLIMQNEQSLYLKVRDLEDGDERAVYKSFGIDMRRYKRLKMFVHTEALNNDVLQNNELRLFIRMGSDINENYYEYEIPLEVTPAGEYAGSAKDARAVWPEQNEIDLALEELTEAKLQRNKAYRMWAESGRQQKTYADVYSTYGLKNQSRIYVKGVPSLAEVTNIVIGVRNPASNGESKSGEIWVNELRLSDFDNQGGWATQGSFTTNFADFSSLTLSGNYSTPGFGTIEQKGFDRSHEEITSFTYNQNFAIGRLFPSFLKLQFPLSLNYAQTITTPEFDPFDTDVKVSDRQEYLTDQEKKEYDVSIDDKTVRRGLNISQFKFNLGGGFPWDPKNFGLMLRYTDNVQTNPELNYNRHYNLATGFNYSWSITPITLKPFADIEWLKSKHWGLINKFHLNLTPSNIYFRTNAVRDYKERKQKNINNPDFDLPASFEKRMDLTTQYGIKFDLMKHLKLKYDVTMNHIVDEDSLQMNWDHRLSETYDLIADEVLDSRMLNFKHTISSSYTLPFNRVPVLSFLSSSISYNASMNWQAEPILNKRVSDLEFGNTLSNNNSINFKARANLQSLYNNFDLVRKLKTKRAKERRKKRNPTYSQAGKYQRKNVTFRLKRPIKFRHRLGTKDLDIKVKARNGDPIKVNIDVIDANTVSISTDKTHRGTSLTIVGQKKKKDKSDSFSIDWASLLLEPAIDFVTMLKSVSFSYTETNSSTLPGYKPKAGLYGMDDWNAPGWKFASGWVEQDFGLEAARKGWVVDDLNHNSAYIVKLQKKYQYQAKLEPIRDLTISLKGNNQKTNSNSSYIMKQTGEWVASNPMESGSHNSTGVFVATAFDKFKVTGNGNYTSPVIEKMKEAMPQISQRLAKNRAQTLTNYKPGDKLYAKGYSSNSQEVLVPAFIAAYSGTSASSAKLSAELPFPLPNWTVNYKGLSNIKFIKEHIGNITLNHAYSAVYNSGTYTTNANYQQTKGFSTVFDASGDNFLPQESYSRISISDKFSPLLGVDLKLKFGLDLGFNYGTSRNSSLSLTNQQVSESYSENYSLTAGYTIKELPVTLRTSSGAKAFKNSIRLNFSFSLDDEQTNIFKLNEDYGEIISGKHIINIKSDASYRFSSNLSLKLYFDYVSSDPKRGSFYTSTTRYGLGVKYTIN